jgi:hypothetical protein
MTERSRFPGVFSPDLAKMACAARPLPIALAHEFAKDTEDEARMAVLARLYVALSDAEQWRCLNELESVRVGQVSRVTQHMRAAAFNDGGDETHHWR